MSTQSNSTAGILALNPQTAGFQAITDARVLKHLAAKKAEDARKTAFDHFPKPSDFLLTTPLYEKTEFSGELAWPVLDLLYFIGTYDCYCVECGQSATFKGKQGDRVAGHTRNLRTEQVHRAQGGVYEHPVLAIGVRYVAAECTRNTAHKQEFMFLIRTEKNGRSIQKIGQFPSYADIHLGEVKSYTSVLTKNQRQELTKAIGLSTHGIGIGSFVYLRRIFEALVEEAHQVAITDAGWDEATYITLRMAEKISALKTHLPAFLSGNPVIYSVLSKGIHELTEDECLKHFDTMRLSIEAILDEKLDQKRRADKAKALHAAIHAAASQIK